MPPEIIERIARFTDPDTIDVLKSISANMTKNITDDTIIASITYGRKLKGIHKYAHNHEISEDEMINLFRQVHIQYENTFMFDTNSIVHGYTYFMKYQEEIIDMNIKRDRNFHSYLTYSANQRSNNNSRVSKVPKDGIIPLGYISATHMPSLYMRNDFGEILPEYIYYEPYMEILFNYIKSRDKDIGVIRGDIISHSVFSSSHNNEGCCIVDRDKLDRLEYFDSMWVIPPRFKIFIEYPLRYWHKIIINPYNRYWLDNDLKKYMHRVQINDELIDDLLKRIPSLYNGMFAMNKFKENSYKFNYDGDVYYFIVNSGYDISGINLNNISCILVSTPSARVFVR